MNLSLEFWLQVALEIGGFGAMLGMIKVRLDLHDKALERQESSFQKTIHDMREDFIERIVEVKLSAEKQERETKEELILQRKRVHDLTDKFPTVVLEILKSLKARES